MKPANESEGIVARLPQVLEDYIEELVRLGLRRFPEETRKCSLMKIVVSKGQAVDVDVPDVLRAEYRKRWNKTIRERICSNRDSRKDREK